MAISTKKHTKKIKKGKAAMPPKKEFGYVIGYAPEAKTKISTNGKASK